ncbi:hypothetical protein PM076_10615 [Halorubrum ezzemoulense]|uniref:DUF1102 domain-containing protein n=1 Tax=Halorubrum ezzemoulense TaxID=337243 RepID=A0ABT4Z101_HALEZ|nr:hypothetical protein [Halorubrum ezzemoulense]MDB2243924.1 hypothetical protein [Halorubrum ezzemoulense]MDB2251990.1 hypothetical protein [Halorubrum ezzemoulense]MDB2277660.1 hypothetical protein [Halorubrum ezzemoulense]MDB2281009.1 hypothetical protein [Halorubrum ezzemoulense]MDB2284370.1 hypothetical protein [Halorubrum ezzemoulense]
MERRKFLIGMGSLAAGGAAALGTGATDSIRTNRDVAVDVTGDANAYLQLDANDTDSDFVNVDSTTGTISFAFDGAGTNAGGVNNNGVTAARPAFTMRNQGNQRLYTEIWNPLRNGDIQSEQQNTRGTASVTVPAGFDFQFVAVPEGKANNFRGSGPGEAALIDRGDGPEVPDNFNPGSGSFGDLGANAYITGNTGDEAGFSGSATVLEDRVGHIPLDPGEAVDVIVRVIADGVDISSTNLPSEGPVYLEAFSEQSSTTFDQLDFSSTSLGIGEYSSP